MSILSKALSFFVKGKPLTQEAKVRTMMGSAFAARYEALGEERLRWSLDPLERCVGIVCLECHQSIASLGYWRFDDFEHRPVEEFHRFVAEWLVHHECIADGTPGSNEMGLPRFMEGFHSTPAEKEKTPAEKSTIRKIRT